MKENVVKVNGYKMTIIPNDKGLSTELLLFKIHEPLTTKLLSRELKSDMVCLDIGANIGYYALLESKIVGDKGKVIAIEPSPTNFTYLKMNSTLDGTSNIEPYNFACGDIDGEIDFVINDNSNLCRVSGNDQTMLNNAPVTTVGNIVDVVKVPVKKLDSFLKEKSIEKLDFIRMDLEGYELHVYRGMKETIRKFKPALYVETHRTFLGTDGSKQLFQGLKDDGYEVKYYTPRWMDTPWVGDDSDIKKITIDEILSKLENNMLPDIFQVFFEPVKH